MFGKNAIYGQKEFEGQSDSLLVTSIFLTLQGEGPFSGRPAVFVRLTHCNLACSFCDTYFDEGTRYSLTELREQIEACINQYYKGGDYRFPPWRGLVLVITGGEPSLQPALAKFCYLMLALFDAVQIESNGIITQPLPFGVTLVVSPKCLEKGDKPIRYLKPTKDMLRRADCLKFVICADSESPYSAIPDWAHEWHDTYERPVYVSPMNIYARQPAIPVPGDSLQERTAKEVISFWQPGLLDMHSNQLNHEYAAFYCLQHGFYLSIQQHLFASLP